MHNEIKSTINKVDFGWTVHLGVSPEHDSTPAIDPREARVDGFRAAWRNAYGFVSGGFETKWVLEAEDYNVARALTIRAMVHLLLQSTVRKFRLSFSCREPTLIAEFTIAAH